MKCNNYKGCNHRLEKIMIKVRKEIIKVDKLLQKCDNIGNTLICYKPNKNEKKEIINTIKTSSRECCILIEELKIHRTEVKYLLNAFSKLVQKYEKIKLIRKNQLQEIENIYCHVKNELLPMISTQEEIVPDSERSTIQNQKNEKLESTFEKFTSLFTSLSKEYEEETKRISARFNSIEEEYKRDKILFSLVTRSIREAFNIRAKIESKQVNFIEYAFTESQDDDENSDCCCNA